MAGIDHLSVGFWLYHEMPVLVASPATYYEYDDINDIAAESSPSTPRTGLRHEIIGCDALVLETPINPFLLPHGCNRNRRTRLEYRIFGRRAA